MKSKIQSQNISGDYGDYRDCILVDCTVSGDFNKISTMVGGKVSGDFNTIEYHSGVVASGDFNKFLKAFSFEVEKKISPDRSNLPEDIREALEIRDEAIEFQKETIQKTAHIEKRKREYFKKYGKWQDKVKAYLQDFYK